MADKRTANTPWQAVDLMTGETVGWYSSDGMAYMDNKDKPITVIYRPKRGKR